MGSELEVLADFSSKLNGLKSGEKISVDLDFSIFVHALGLVVEREDRKLSRPLNIWLWKKDKRQSCYDLSSEIEDKRYSIITENPDWHLVGGEVNPDNLQGNYFLRLSPLTNFGSNAEARLSLSKIERIHSISLEIKPIEQ